MPVQDVGSGLTVLENVRGSGSIQGKSTWYALILWQLISKVVYFRFSGIVKMMNADRHLNGSRSRGRRSKTLQESDIQGLYMYGGVGVGKTMLMDMFVESKPSAVKVN